MASYRNILSSDKQHTKVYSMVDKGFDDTKNPPFYLATYQSASTESQVTEVRINPKVSAPALIMDSFCEKPAYVPLKSSTDEGFSDAKKFSIYFPFGDKLEGYSLYDIFRKDFIPAKGTLSAQDNNIYYEIRDGAYRQKKGLVEGDSLSGLYVASNNITLEKSINISSNVYNTPISSLGLIGKKINFSYDGLMPGTTDSNVNLLYNKNLRAVRVFSGNESEVTLNTGSSVYRTKSYEVPFETGAKYYIELQNIEFTDEDAEGYTFSFCVRLDDTCYVTGDPSTEDVNNRKIQSPLTGTFKLLDRTGSTIQELKVEPVTFTTDWTQVKIFIENAESIKGKTLNLAVIVPELSAGVSVSKAKLCGFMLNKGLYAVSFDDRYHIYHEDSAIQNKIYPILINFISKSEEDSIRMKATSSWTINYKRVINASPTSSALNKIDVIGNNLFSYGYKNGHPVFYVKGEPENIVTSIFAKDFVGNLENIFVTYNSDTNVLTYSIYSKDYGYKISFNNVDASLQNIQASFENTDSTAVLFNLILGGYIDNSELKVNNFTKYSDLMIFPYVLSDEEIDKMNNVIMSVTTGVSMYVESDQKITVDNEEKIVTKYELVKDKNVLRSSSFFETTNI